MKKNLLLTLCSVLIVGSALQTQAQNINTYAGNGVATYVADGVAAVTAPVNNPYGVAVDYQRNVYIADYGNNRIRKIDYATGLISTIAGNGTGGWSGDGGPATAAMIKNPRGIAVDNLGNVFFSDYGNNRIRKISAAGIISHIAGNADGFPIYYNDGGHADTAHVGNPWGLCVDPAGNIYFADQLNNRVRKINTAGIISTYGGNGISAFGGDGGQATAAKIQYPLGVGLDGAGNLYVADNGNNRIRKITPAGIISSIAGSATYGFAGDGGPSTASKLYYPRGIAVDIAGNVYICDVNNNRIRKINTGGIITTLTGTGAAAFSGDGGPAGLAAINQSTGVAVDTFGNIYIADNDNNRIRIINAILHAPTFNKGHNSNLIACPGENIIDSLMPVFDVDAGQTETWSLIAGPYHGFVNATYSTISTGAVLNTSGLYYAPTAGYFGTDSFQVRVTDGTYSDTTMVHVTVIPSPSPAMITGKDSLCPGPAHQIYLSDATPGGVWSNYAAAVTTVSASGAVTGVATGYDTIYYIVTNTCGTGKVSHLVYVRTLTVCATGVNATMGNADGISLFPNPNSGALTVSLSSVTDEEVQFTITNLTGQKVKEFASRTNKHLDIQLNEPPGIYFISAVTVDGKWVQKMTIIK